MNTKQDFRSLKKGDEFSIRGMRYKVVEPYDAKNERILVSVYKDYPLGGFDEENSYYLNKDKFE